MAVRPFGIWARRARGAASNGPGTIPAIRPPFIGPGLGSGVRPDRGRVRSPAEVAAELMCSCTATSFSTPAGDVIVVQVFGEIDLFTCAVLRDALADSLACDPCELIVDLAGTTFCDVAGMRLLIETGTAATGSEVGYAVAGTPARIGRLRTLLWPDAELPMQFSSAALALLAAMAHQVSQDRGRWAPKQGPGRVRRWSRHTR